MAKQPPYRGFQTWLLERMVDLNLTPMSLAMRLGVLDGDVESWVAGRTVPSRDQCERLAQLFEIPVDRVLAVANE